MISEKKLITPAAKVMSFQLKLIETTPQGATAALFCQGREVSWLQRICRRLPANLFENLRVAGDGDHLFLLLPDHQGARFFPFARPLRLLGDKIFIPRDLKFSPQTPTETLEKLLAISPGNYCFVSRKWHYEIAAEAFKPLSANLFSDCLPPVKIIAAGPAELSLQAPEDLWEDRKEQQDREQPMPANPIIVQQSAASAPDSASPQEQLLNFAARLSREKDFLGAATCFSLAGDQRRAAECYRLAALQLQQT